MAKEEIEISNLITSLADGIRKAKIESASASPVIELQDCEVELAVTAKVGANGGIKFWIVSAGADAEASTVSKVKLRFTSVGGAAGQFVQETSHDGPEIPKRVEP